MWALWWFLPILDMTHGCEWALRATDQLPMFKKALFGDSPERAYGFFPEKPIGVMTVAHGRPVELNETDTVNAPELMNNDVLVESLESLARERIPERVVHAKGAGAFGYFEVTHDITDYCKAKLLSNIGKKTPVAVRFSSVIENNGGADTYRDNRGFAVKFYTEEGNWDLVMVHFEAFLIKDPLYFPSFAHAFKKNPKTRLYDANSKWDFLTSRQETILFVLSLFSDIGIIDGYRHVRGFPIHTYQLYNDKGESHFVRFRFMPDAGVQTLDSANGTRLAGEDPDYNNRDLYEAILNGEFPSWTVSIQHMTPEDTERADFNPFDVTLVWPIEKYPPQPIGKLVLNENPSNYFADVEQMAYNVAHMVPGVRGAGDNLFVARRRNYRDATIYRLGINYKRIPVNFPKESGYYTYYRDGRAPVDGNFDGIPNYYPNSFNGPMPYVDKNIPDLIRPYVDPRPTNFGQASDMYEDMDEDERKRLVTNIVGSLSKAEGFLQKRAVKWFTEVNPDFGKRVAKALKNPGPLAEVPSNV